MKKYLITLLLIVFIIPSVAFASWWNPFSWKIFQKKNNQATQNVDTATTSENLLLPCNGSKYNKCSEGQNFICPTNGEDAFCEKTKLNEIKTPKIKESTAVSPIAKTVKTETSEKLKVQTKPVTETTNFNTTIFPVIDSLIKIYTDYITFFRKFDDILIAREQESMGIKQKIDSSLNPATGVQNDILILLSKSRADEISYIKSTRINYEQNIATLENSLSLMKQYRTQKEKMFYTQGDALKEAKDLMPLYDKLDPYMESSSKFREAFFDYTGKNDDLFTNTITALKNNLTLEISNLEYERRALAQSAPTFQSTMPPIQLPQLPKITECNTSYLGVYGNYSMTCIQR